MIKAFLREGKSHKHVSRTLFSIFIFIFTFIVTGVFTWNYIVPNTTEGKFVFPALFLQKEGDMSLDNLEKSLSDSFLSSAGGTVLGDLIIQGELIMGDSGLTISSSGALTTNKPITVGGTQIINAFGKIPALISDFFTSLDATKLTGKIYDSDHLDGISSSSFLRSDESDTASAAINFTSQPGSTAVGGGPIYINPAAVSTDYTLFGVAINDSLRFKIDAEGDVTTAGNLSVLGSGTFGGNFEMGGYYIDNVGRLQFSDDSIQTTAQATTATFVVCASNANNTGRCDYVADGTDDEVEIEAAIDALPSGGGSVFLSEGTYRVEDITISDKSNIQISGSGAVLQTKDSPTGNQNVLYIYNSDHVVVNGLIIDGNGPNLSNIGNIEDRQNGIVVRGGNDIILQNVEVRWFRMNGIFVIHGAKDVIIENSHIHDGNTGILTYYNGFSVAGDGPTEVIIRSNIIEDMNIYESTPRVGIYIAQDSSDILVENNILRNNGAEAVNLVDTSFVTVTGNSILDSITFGINSQGSSVTDVTITDNLVDNSGSHGVNFLVGERILVSGNKISNNGGSGIRFDVENGSAVGNNLYKNGERGILFQNCSYGNISGNVVKENGQTTPNLYGGIEVAVVSHFTINNNNVGSSGESTQKYGLMIYNSSDVKASNNILFATATSRNLYFSGSSNLGLRNNIGYINENSGTATVASGATYVDVSHGLGITPSINNINVTPTNNLGSATKFWISNVGASTFRINVDIDPGVTTATFSWTINP